jgi:esterase/lipase superfamily enzyme
VLKLIANIGMQQQVVLAGHSMGGWLVMETLRQLRLQGRDDVLRRFQVALAAPDIDIDVFRRQVDVIGRLSPALTILVARDDRALDFSGALTGGRRRVGTADVDDPVLQDVARRQHLRIVDISSVQASDGMLHDRFVRFAAIHSTALAGGGSAASSLQQAGAFIFNATGAALASPFTMIGRAFQSAD